MSCPPEPFLVRDEIAAHRARVFAAFSRHSDPTVRAIGRLLAAGTATPHELLDDPHRATALDDHQRKHLDELSRRVFGPPVPFDVPLGGSAAEPRTRPASESLNGSAAKCRRRPASESLRSVAECRRRPASEPPGGSAAEPWRRPAPGAAPASRSRYTDPDNGAGGVPAIRR